MRKKSKGLIGIVAALLVAAGPAFAAPPPHAKAKGHSSHAKHDEREQDRNAHIVIEAQERDTIYNYYHRHPTRHCPPGLAKKNPYCLPPGQYKKYYPGDILPTHVAYYPLPRDLLVQLRPVPTGFQYVRVDQNVYLISEASHKIIDAIVLLSAVH